MARKKLERPGKVIVVEGGGERRNDLAHLLGAKISSLTRTTTHCFSNGGLYSISSGNRIEACDLDYVLHILDGVADDRKGQKKDESAAKFLKRVSDFKERILREKKRDSYKLSEGDMSLLLLANNYLNFQFAFSLAQDMKWWSILGWPALSAPQGEENWLDLFYVKPHAVICVDFSPPKEVLRSLRERGVVCGSVTLNHDHECLSSAVVDIMNVLKRGGIFKKK